MSDIRGCALLVMLALVSSGCVSTLQVRRSNPLPAAEQTQQLSMEPQADAGLQARLEARLRSRGVPLSDTATSTTMSLHSLELDSGRRALYERQVYDGGPRRIERDYHLVQVATATLRLSTANEPPRELLGRVIADPRSDQRHDGGRWFMDDGEVLARRGSRTVLEQAAIDAAIDQLVASVFAAPSGDKEVVLTITLDSSRRDLRPWLRAAADGAHRPARQALLAIAEAEGHDGPLAYNIAALYEIEGDYASALQWYGIALAHQPRDFYRAAWERCHQGFEAASAP